MIVNDAVHRPISRIIFNMAYELFLVHFKRCARGPPACYHEGSLRLATIMPQEEASFHFYP